jgi:DNA-directed RNA polymerase beta subunit
MEERRNRPRSRQVAQVGGKVNPSDIQLTPGQQLLYTRVIPHCNPVLSQIAGYNNILTTRIQQVLSSQILYGARDPKGRYSVYTFKMTRYTPAQVKSDYEALKGKKTIDTDIYIQVERTWRDANGDPIMETVVQNGKRIEVIVRDVSDEDIIASIPIPRGSLPDSTSLRRDRYEQGDAPLLPDGYFVLDGSRRYIVLYNKLKYDMPLTYANKDGEVMTNVICTTPDISTVHVVIHHTPSHQLLARTSLLGSVVEDSGQGKSKKSKMRFIFLYEYMVLLMTRKETIGMKEVNVSPTPSQISDLILYYVPTEYFDVCRTLLLLSENTVRDRVAILTDIKGQIRLDESIDVIERRLIEEVYPIIPRSHKELKAKQLAYVASRHLLYLAGVYQPHDRDAPALYRMDSPEIVITKLFADKFRAAVDGVKARSTTKNETGVDDLVIDREVVRAIAVEGGRKEKQVETLRSIYKPMASLNIMNYLAKVKDEVRSAFKKGNFGGKQIKRPQETFKEGSTMTQQKGIIAALDTSSFSQAWSNMTKRAVPTSNKGPSIKVRSGHPGRVGYEDLLKSPDNGMIGLIMFLASTCWISSWRDPSPIVEAIARLANQWGYGDRLPESKDPSTDATDLVLVGGVIQGYANGRLLVDSLNLLRETDSRLQPYFDSMFFYDEVRKEVQILTDAGRLTRPVLVVDRDELVIDKKGLNWNTNLDILLREGAIRFVDSYEAEYGAQAAQYPDYFRVRWNEVREAERVRDTILSSIENTEGDTVSGVEIEILLSTLTGYRVAYKRGVVPIVREREVTKVEALAQVDLLNRHISKARSRLNYNYCEIDADVILGFSSGIVPYLNRTSGTKQAYAAHMNTQAIGQSTPNYVLNNSATLRLLNNGQRGMTETGMASIMGLTTLPASQNAIVAIMSGTAYGDYGGGIQEDAIQLSQSAVDRGLFSYTIHKRVTYNQPVTSSANVRSSRPSGTEYNEKYVNLDVRGVVRKGTEIKEGDVLISMEIQTSSGKWKRKDTVARGGESGIVTDVYYVASPLYVQITLSEVRKPVAGSKLSSMHANKGVVAEVTPDSEMPIDPVTGMKPDVIFHPIGIPSRGIVGLLIEMLAGSASALLGQRTNAAGMSQELRVDQMARVLSSAGFNPNGEYRLLDRRSGEFFRGDIYMGVAQMQLINKTIEEDANWVGVVNRHPWNMQPVKGKKKGGGLRMGVNEGDALAYHGMESMRRSVYYRASDGIKVPICQRCGLLASVSKTIGTYECNYCTNTLPSAESHLARDIAQVEIAGSWRHIQQVLLMRGIQVTHQLRPQGQLTE